MVWRIIFVFIASVAFSAASPVAAKGHFNPKKGLKDYETVFFLTMPKGGTHLLMKAIYLISGKWMSLGESAKINGKDVYFNHLWPILEQYKTTPNILKVIHLRDPRDMVISQMFWLEKEEWPGLPLEYLYEFREMSKNEKINYLLQLPREYWGPTYFPSVMLDWKKNTGVIFSYFEDLVGFEGGGSRLRQEKAIRNLAECLGYKLSNQLIAQIADDLFGDTGAHRDGKITFREGKIGSWKTHFNEDNKILCKKLMGEALITLGYEMDNDW